LKLATAACRQNERNKIALFGAHSKAIVGWLCQTMEEPDKKTEICQAACELVTILGKYDDRRSHSSSAHDHVVALARAGMVDKLYKLAVYAQQQQQQQQQQSTLLIKCMQAIRTMVVNDDIVQSFVAVGILPILQTTLDSCVQQEQQHSKNTTDSIVVATLGLARNLCANDDIKTDLCQNTNLVPNMIFLMKEYKHVPAVAEHACATIAAMALREPKNAIKLVRAYSCASSIATAMRQHRTMPVVQRQAALAIRNICSRLTDEDDTAVRDAFLDLGVEDLLHKAAHFSGSIDEAYAALRDLNCRVQMVRVEKDPLPPSSFRPVFEESKELNHRIHEL